jgi:hypothetical protein
MSFLKDLFQPNDLQDEKDMLDAFDLGDPALTNQVNDMDIPAVDPPCIVDELMSLAGNVFITDDKPVIDPVVGAPLPLDQVTVNSCQPLHSNQQPQQPIWNHTEPSYGISPLASGAVEEYNFPRKLYRLLEDCQNNPQWQSIVSWSRDGTYFQVISKQRFVEVILPNYFEQTQYASFRRQLNMYNFVRKGSDPKSGAYQNPYFFKGRPDLLDKITRKSVNPNKGK